MNLLKSMWNFIRRGNTVFSQAARGQFVSSSSDIEDIRQELNSKASKSGILIDKENLILDRRRINRDVTEAFNKYKLSHGYK